MLKFRDYYQISFVAWSRVTKHLWIKLARMNALATICLCDEGM